MFVFFFFVIYDSRPGSRTLENPLFAHILTRDVDSPKNHKPSTKIRHIVVKKSDNHYI